MINGNGTSERLLIKPEDLKSLEPEDREIGVHQFDWIPGTHVLLFNTALSGMGISDKDDLYMINADTLDWKILRRAGEGGSFSVSPDGKHVVMVTPSKISLMKVDGTGYRSLLKYSQIDTRSEYYYYAHPIWSRDSQSLIVDIPPREFMDNPSVTPRIIWQLFINGKPPKQVAQLPAQYDYLISPNFSKIAYIRSQGNAVYEIHIANIDGSEDIVYQFGSGMILDSWSPDSESFLLLSRYAQQYYLATLGNKPIPLTEKDSRHFLWIDESYFLYKTFYNGLCELHLGTVNQPSTILATLHVDLVKGGCSNEPYDFAR